MPTNVLYLSYDGMTDSLGQSQVLPYLKGLTPKGFQFHIISFEKEERFEKFRDQIQQICDDAGIIWHPLSYTKKPPLLSTIYDVRRMRSLARKLHKQLDFKIVHCRSYLSALVGMKMQKDLGIKFLFDMRGFWADERVEGNIWSLSNPVFKTVYDYFKKKEKQYFLKANHIVSLTYCGKDEIVSWKGFEHLKDKIEVIPCCVDLHKFDPSKVTDEAKKQARTELGIGENQKVLGYVGSIGTWYMLDEMLHFFKRFQSENPDAIFLFITGEPAEMVRKRAAELGVDNGKILVKSVLHSEVPLHVSLFTASVFFIRPSFSKKASSPTKQGELMAMGVPIYCNDGVGDTGKVIRDYRAGKVVPLDDMSFSQISLEINDFDRMETQKGANEFYGLETGVQRYYSVYQKLMK